MKVSPLARRMHTWWPVVLGTTHSKAVIGSCDDGWPPTGGPSSSVAVKIKLPKESPDNFIVPILATAAYRRLNRSSAVEHSMCQPSVRTYIDWEGPDAGRSWAACSRSDAVIHEADAGCIDARGCDMKIGRREDVLMTTTSARSVRAKSMKLPRRDETTDVLSAERSEACADLWNLLTLLTYSVPCITTGIYTTTNVATCRLGHQKGARNTRNPYLSTL